MIYRLLILFTTPQRTHVTAIYETDFATKEGREAVRKALLKGLEGLPMDVVSLELET